MRWLTRRLVVWLLTPIVPVVLMVQVDSVAIPVASWLLIFLILLSIDYRSLVKERARAEARWAKLVNAWAIHKGWVKHPYAEEESASSSENNESRG